MNILNKYIGIIIFALALMFRLWGLNAQGETWDEAAYYDAGRSFIINIYHHDYYSNDWEANKEHPPIAKYIYGFVSVKPYLREIINYTNGRAVSAIMGALIVYLTYLVGKNLFSRKIGVLGAVIVNFMPWLVGLNKVYGLDTPTALFFTLTVYLFIRAVQKSSHWYYLLTGLALGFAIGTRFSNFLLFLLLPIIFLIYKFKDLIKGRDRIFLIYILIIPILSLLVFYGSWPWLWSETINHWNQSIGHWGGVKELIFGRVQSPSSTYYLMYLAITTPVLILALIIPFVYKTIIEKDKNYFVLIAWVLVVLLTVLSPTKQNGVRYIVSIYPAIALMASIGLFAVFKNKISIAVALSVLVIYLVFVDLSVHPYYLSYYNEIVGGPHYVYTHKLFPLGWWGDGVEEAYRWTEKNAKPGSRIFINSTPDNTTGSKTRDDLIFTSDNPDYVIVNLNTLWGKNYEVDKNNFKLVYQVKVSEVPIVEVYKRK